MFHNLVKIVHSAIISNKKCLELFKIKILAAAIFTNFTPVQSNVRYFNYGRNFNLDICLFSAATDTRDEIMFIIFCPVK